MKRAMEEKMSSTMKNSHLEKNDLWLHLKYTRLNVANKITHTQCPQIRHKNMMKYRVDRPTLCVCLSNVNIYAAISF